MLVESMPQKTCHNSSIQIMKDSDIFNKLLYEQPDKDHSPASQSFSFHTHSSTRGEHRQHDISMSNRQQNTNFSGDNAWANLNSGIVSQ